LRPNACGIQDRTIFDAIPLPAFVVDADAQILDMNRAAVEFCGQDLNAVYKRRGGDVLHCLHATDVPEGCGRGPSCSSCIIRNSVKACLKGQTVTRRIMNLQLASEASPKDLQILVTASPMPGSEERTALLILEDITEISALKNIIPMCMKCRKIRNDEQYWQTVEQYFHEHIGVDFSHGICPKCVDEFFPEFRVKPAGNKAAAVASGR
jgi:hypothetical protein